jgi:hypothetical protein
MKVLSSRRRRAAFGLALGLVLSLAGLCAGEAFLRLIAWDERGTITDWPDQYWNAEADFPKPRPGTWRTWEKRASTGELIYDVTYSVDQFGRRITPVTSRELRKKFLLFFGCSYTYGEGVQDDETLAYHAGTLAPGYMPYNYAFHGGGPFDAMARMEEPGFNEQIAEQDGIGIYVYMQDHVNRVADAPGTAKWHYGHTYYDRTDDGRFVRNGTFATGRPFRTAYYRFLYESRLLRALGLAEAKGSKEARIDLAADAIAAVAERFHARFPHARFYVVAYPSKRPSEMADRLRQRGIDFIDNVGLFDTADPLYHLSQEDWHPTPAALRALAVAVVEKLDISDEQASSEQSGERRAG